MIKAIETVYNGYRFRSRLEARWAVFFDTLDIEYQYEPEGVKLSSGWYLPDFWLPQHRIWFEVKGREPNHTESRLATELCAASGHKTVIYSGQIEIPNKYNRRFLITSIGMVSLFYQDYFTHTLNNLPRGTVVLKQNVHLGGHRGYLVHGPLVRCFQNPRWGECSNCGQFDLTPNGIGYHHDCARCHFLWHRLREERYPLNPYTPKLIDAFTAARQARFEHGENG